MNDYREMNFCEYDLENADRKIRNGGYSPDELCDIFSNKELAAMWNYIEGEYDYSVVEFSPNIEIPKRYLQERLVRAIHYDGGCEDTYAMSDHEMRVYFDYWMYLKG